MAILEVKGTMLYCPKCQASYKEGTQRFCTNDGMRLHSAEASNSSRNQTRNVFTNLLERTSSSTEKDEKLSAVPRFVPSKPVPPKKEDSRRLITSQVFTTEQELKPKIEPPISKPHSRFVKKEEISTGTAAVGDRAKNPAGRPALTTENPEVLLGQKVKGRYLISEKLEQDENSINFLAVDEITPQRKVTVRVLVREKYDDNITGKIFAEERVSLSLINHPNVVRVIDSGQLIEGIPFIVSEFVEGSTVAEMLEKAGQFNPLRTARIIRQASYALSEVHQNGILHRDLKPEDVILTISEAGTEMVKLSNFGVSDGKIHEKNLAYKSPEQLDGNLATFASDIYALAAIAFQMLTDRTPYNGSLEQLYISQQEGLMLYPTNLRLDLPPLVDKILEKALAFNPADRYPKARDFGEAFYNALTIVSPWKTEETYNNGEVVESISTEAETEEDEDILLLEDIPTISEIQKDFNVENEEDPAEIKPETSPVKSQIHITASEQDDESPHKFEDKTPLAMPWEKRSPEPPKVSGLSWILMAALGIALLLTGVWGILNYLQKSAEEAEFSRKSVESINPPKESSEEKLTTTAPEAEIESPPLPRQISPPENSVFFENVKDELSDELKKNFLGFSLYYPNNWKINRYDKNGEKVDDKFIDISKTAPNGYPLEQFLVSPYPSKGLFSSDRKIFPKLVEKSNKDLSNSKTGLPNYKVISEGETTIQNGRWNVYEVKFQGMAELENGEKLMLWGRRFWIPVQHAGARTGFIVTLFATSLSPDVKSLNDVGVKGELAKILETFEPAQVN